MIRRFAWLVFCLVLAGCAVNHQGAKGPIPASSSPGTQAPTGGGGGTGAMASCASMVRFHGNDYLGRYAAVAPQPQEALGLAVVPACNDMGNQTSPLPDASVEVSRIDGVDPELAIVETTNSRTIYIRSESEEWPPELTRYFHAPDCRTADAPLTLEGPWTGIIEPGGHTELDLLPPYNLEMTVTEGSSDRYLDAQVKIEVRSLEAATLTHDDVKASLWEGGTLRVVATCSDGHFVATTVEASPPA